MSPHSLFNFCLTRSLRPPIHAGPGATVELNLITQSSDYYDVSVIAGVNVPASITPTVVDSTNTGGPYVSGNPGSSKPNVAGLGASSWSFSPPSNQYQWVTPPSGATVSCTANSQCASGQVCGLVEVNDVFSEVCGYLSGYWSTNRVCALNANAPYFGCATSFSDGGIQGTYGSFYQCGVTSGERCYLDQSVVKRMNGGY